MVIATAAVLREIDASFTFQQVTTAPLRAGELLVRIHSTGLCHTDLSIALGHLPAPLPIVLGHEGAGVVAEVGRDVDGFAIGDHVALSFASCGECRNCATGRDSYCDRFVELNFGGTRADGSVTLLGADGAPVHGSFFGQSSFATNSVVQARNAVKLPEALPLEIAGPLGCGIQTGAGAVLNALRLAPGASLVVSGAGPVGLAAIMAASASEANPIIAVDLVPERLALARELGATHTINPRDVDLRDAIHDITGPLGSDAAVDTTAVPAVLEAVIDATRFGGAVVSLGIPRPDATVPIGLFGGKRILGVIEGDCVPREFIPRLLALHAAGRFPYDRMITTYPFADLDRAIDDTRSGKAVKAVLIM